ncbi:sugar ABC transporter substrate-binding protein [Virgibacillus natechei]
MNRRFLILSFSIILLLFITGCSQDSQSAGNETGDDSSDEGMFIGQSYPTASNPWYVSFEEGSKGMAEQLGINLDQVANPPDEAMSPSAQVSRIEDLIGLEPDVISIDPASTDAINAPIDMARERDIPVVVSGINVSTDVDSSITADNYQGGELAGEYLAEILNGEGKVAILQGTPGRDIVQNREDGFKESIGQYEGIEIVAEQIADMERSAGVTVAENILQANPDLDAIWAANDEMALGAVEAVRGRDLIGEVKIGGFDATPDALTAIENGEMHFTADQVPFEMGARAIAVSYMAANDMDYPTELVLDMNLVTTENISESTGDQENNQILDEVIEEYGLN